MWVGASAKTPTSRRRRSRRVCLPDQGRGTHREGAPPARHGGWGARATWRYSRRKARVATVYTNAPKRLRGAILADLCTLLRPRACPQLLHSPTVYTNAPKRRGEARSSHLCTLLRSQGHPQPKSTAQQCTRMPQNDAERPFPLICVHSCVPTTARVTGWGHWSHDVDGPMAPVMPGRSDLRPTPPRRWRNHPPTRTHEVSYKVCIMCHGQLTGDIDRLIWRKENGAERKPDHMKQPAPMAPNGFKLPVQRVTLADGNCA